MSGTQHSAYTHTCYTHSSTRLQISAGISRATTSVIPEVLKTAGIVILAPQIRAPDILWGYSETDPSSRQHIGSWGIQSPTKHVGAQTQQIKKHRAVATPLLLVT